MYLSTTQHSSSSGTLLIRTSEGQQQACRESKMQARARSLTSNHFLDKNLIIQKSKCFHYISGQAALFLDLKFISFSSAHLDQSLAHVFVHVLARLARLSKWTCASGKLVAPSSLKMRGRVTCSLQLSSHHIASTFIFTQ